MGFQDCGLIQVVDGLKEQAEGPGEGLKSLNLSNNHISQNGIMHLGKFMVMLMGHDIMSSLA